MLVYGDHHELAEPLTRAREINRELDSIDKMPRGIGRHARLVGALVKAGKLLQGVADAAFAEAETDGPTPSADALNKFLLELGAAVCRSWDSGFEDVGTIPRLTAADWPTEVELRVPEGFAFYALYPEAYLEAAQRLKLDAPPRVIGIRSIGTSLAAIVAAALGAPPPITVRPFGDPFSREIAVDHLLERDLLAGDAHYVIVDEGPGQSGSSFAAVADWLQERGVPSERIALLPSHDGVPGSAANGERLRWWRSVQREVGDFPDWPALVDRFFTAAIGPLDEPPTDVSGGVWRRFHCPDEKHWPATVPAWERRKFLVRSGGEPFLVKFAGLGRIGEEKLRIAQALHSEGLAPKPVGLVHGFLIERWCDNAAPLGSGEAPIAEIGRYIGARAKLLPAAAGSGASIDALLAIIRRNVSLEFGDELARIAAAWEQRAGDLERRIVRVRTDNKLDRHEWLRSKSGALIKADALDHHQAHDLIGCQDLAWDVAGAAVQFDLDQARLGELVGSVEHWAGREVDPALLDFYRIAYLAFRLGHARLGAIMTSDAAEARRISRSGDRYAAELQHLLERTSAATRLDSLVG